jgi:CheY-like chemotaxis protein
MGSTSVLVVEDNPICRATAMDMLGELGLRVFGAYSGEAALALIKAHPEIRLMFIDIRMPGMSGPELGELVRQQYPAIRIVMTSGSIGEEAAPSGLPFLKKPWRSSEVQKAVLSAAA